MLLTPKWQRIMRNKWKLTAFMTLMLVASGSILHADGSPLVSKRQLTVSIGKSSYLQPEDLQIEDPGNNLCVVKVVSVEPMWTRAGSVHPQMFNCHFKFNSVSYRHNGNPSLKEDEILFSIYRFDGNGSHQVQTIVRVVIVDLPAKNEIFVRTDPSLNSMSVPRGQVSDVFDHKCIRFVYSSLESESCLVSYQSGQFGFPTSGIIEDDNGSTVSNFSLDCREFLSMGYRFRHLGSDSPDSDYLPISAQLDKPNSTVGWETTVENLFIQVRIPDASPNTRPEIRLNGTVPIKVEQFGLSVLDQEIISAFDEETNEKQLIFRVVTTMDPVETGFFVDLKANSRPVLSFRQEDVINQRLAYNPPTKPLMEEKEVEVEMVAYDGHFAASHPIKIRFLVVPTKTLAPRIAYNGGLVVREGGLQPLTVDDFTIFDANNLQNVEIHVKGGLKHGALEVNGRPGIAVFTVRDMVNRLVVYRHDNTDSTEDRIILRVSDGRQSIRTKISITIFPIDDNAPYLLTHESLTVKIGNYVQVTGEKLSAHDKDYRDDKDVRYVMRSTPKTGEIVKRFNPLTKGHQVTTFTQPDIDRGVIYYHHLGGEVTTDVVEFRLLDDADPPNKSGKYTMEIKVEASNDLPPQPVEDATRKITVNETETVALTRSCLWYEDVEVPSTNVIYTITSQPCFLASEETVDAGRLVLIDEDMEDGRPPAKQAGSKPLKTFTQRDVDGGRVVFQPPMDGIGSNNLTARFVFAVTDLTGNSIMDQTFDVTIIPVDSNIRLVSAVRERFRVVQGGTVRFLPEDILAYDPDTDLTKLIFKLESEPKYGQLLRNGVAIVKGQQFVFEDITGSDVRYANNGSQSSKDSLELSVTDGLRIFSKTLAIDIDPNRNQRPQPVSDLNNNIDVDEDGEVSITSENLAAIDNDTDDLLLNFLVMKSPEFGEIRLGGRAVEQFTQTDIVNGKVSYVHTGGEIGRQPISDSITFMVLDQSPPPAAAETVPLIDLEVSIAPVDNSAPELLIGGPVVVVEGKPASITPDIISARDVDSVDESLMFIVSQTPMWGFLERSKSNTRSGRSQTSRRISSFTLADLKEGTVQYVPSNLSKGGPPSDSFFVYVTDGQNQSPLSQVEIIVLPLNIKLQDFEIGNLEVKEGGEKEFVILMNGGNGVLQRSSGSEDLTLSVAAQPFHGELVLVVKDPQNQIRFHDVVVADRETDIRLIYRHDGSESKEDHFTLSLSDGTHVVKRTATVTVLPVNDLKPELTRNLPLLLDFGESKTISSLVLKATDDDSASDEIYFVIVTTPNKGILEVDDSDDGGGQVVQERRSWRMLEAGENVTQSAIDENRLRYVHTTELGESSSDKFLFRLTDGVNFLPSAAFLVEISRSNPRRILIRNRGLSVKTGETKVIPVESLGADDGGNNPSDLMFTITKTPLHGTLELIDQKARHTNIGYFSQADLVSMRIFYVHRNVESGMSEDSFAFSVSSTKRDIPPTVSIFRISILPRERPSLSVLHNVPLTVFQGKTVKILNGNLQIESQLRLPPANLTFTIIEGPKHGELQVRGRPVIRSFTQKDINTGEVEYKCDDSDDSMTDYFLFNVTDGSHKGYMVNGTHLTKPIFFNILIQPISNEPPRIVRNRTPEKLLSFGADKTGFLITSDYLKVVHPSFESLDIVYSIKDGPSDGSLEMLRPDRQLKRKFTQKDIDDGKIIFVLNPLTGSTNDTIHFQVQDPNRNSIDDIKFIIKWAVIEIAHTQYSVCEDSGILSIKLIRRGSTSVRSSVSVRTKQLSAKEGLDFIPKSGSVVTFEPGMSEFSWLVEIVKDIIEDEPAEKFKVILRNPDNALLGDVTRSVVDVINVEDGMCEFHGPFGERDTSLKDFGRNSADVFNKFQSYDNEEIDADDEKLYGDDYDNSDLEDTQNPFMVTSHRFPKQKQNPRDTGIRKNWGNRGKKSEPARKPHNKTKVKIEHPLKKYKKTKKGNGPGGGERGKVKWTPLVEKFEDGGRRGGGRTVSWRETTSLPTTTTTQPRPPTSTGMFVPQECDRDTKGLLYFDMLSSKMYRCNGWQWEARGWGTGDGYQYTALLKDAEDSSSTKEEEDSKSDWTNSKPSQKSPDSEQTAAATTRKSCKTDWSIFGELCYKLADDRAIWTDGEEQCVSEGGHLANVQSEEHLLWLWQMTSEATFWIGLNNRDSSGSWSYIGGSDVTYFNWRRNFPRKNSGRRRNCVMVGELMEWINRPCDSAKANFVCVQSAVSRPRRQPKKLRIS